MVSDKDLDELAYLSRLQLAETEIARIRFDMERMLEQVESCKLKLAQAEWLLGRLKRNEDDKKR